MTHRYCARILVEAATPLKIGTGEQGLNIDERVATDANGLPLIPGTALAGVLRHAFRDQDKVKDIFGFQERKKGAGSRLSVSSAHFVGREGEVIDGPAIIDFKNDTFYSMFRKMAVRDHVCIDHRGVAGDTGKFDSQLVYKGCRFVFDLELKGAEDDGEVWSRLLKLLHSPLFRLGGGTRKGFGELSVKAIDEDVYNLREDSARYMARSARLTVPVGTRSKDKADADEGIIVYNISLRPDDFFIFSAGYGDNDVDSVSKKEPVITWENGRPSFSAEKLLIPASSVKGALSHRTAFHYNRLNGIYADKLDTNNFKQHIGENNKAVKEIFGCASDIVENKGQRGRIILSDVYIESYTEKIFNHVAIDRFTGGAIDGALFDEKVVHTKEEITFKIIVEKKAFYDKKVKEAFERAIKDMTTGMLPLGGSVMRGHGCFYGHSQKN